jgi:anhydro-N-acetylmuramic acid kinase
MNPHARLIAGAMSGTSADGVDVAITRIEGRGLEMSAKLVLHHHRAYEPETRRDIFEMRKTGVTTLRNLADITRRITLTYANAVNEVIAQAKLAATDLAAVAAHGQTLFHDPPLTIQIFDPSLLAGRIGCAVVSDFRRADLAAGGQGAPLVPFADYVLLRDAKKSRVLLNLGGIANISYIPAGGGLEDVIAFDTGPGNCVLDHLMRQAGGDVGFDRDGAMSLAGTVNPAVLRGSVASAFFARRPPKSTDGPEMIDAFESAMKQEGTGELSLADKLATACAASAAAITESLSHLPAGPDEIIASGGGTKNPRLMREIRELSKLPVKTIDEIGVPSDAKEAIAFALLAAATLDRVPSNVPSATGAQHRVVLGSITPAPR